MKTLKRELHFTIIKTEEVWRDEELHKLRRYAKTRMKWRKPIKMQLQRIIRYYNSLWTHKKKVEKLYHPSHINKYRYTNNNNKKS